ncbi:uncharacterized protein LACBIDRAFT_329486 [Laccaria bicolor S238N-H82]|uniref:Predicted protein n=1 Tax=Laccaria bicolor (strain S238N-H82 / ATCC MYA-4686) TaxID=486041 RepID=B0DI63_LACBS|nr:uncharacterized protein LACBIDRAFT_329486 [Laccaria bicolor S238N-H82]EDR05523.1 predicted protein [Laccaria bicolor S238N-H82]|eukprot:XP_001883627.1 predicted protein [Laccaria bicolor S238N-H82]
MLEIHPSAIHKIATWDNDNKYANAPALPALFLTPLDVSYDEQVMDIGPWYNVGREYQKSTRGCEHVGLNDTNVLMSELLPFVSCVVKFHDMNEWHNTNVPLHPLLLMLMPTAVSTLCHNHPLEYVGLNNAKMLLSKFLSDIVCTSLLFLCLFRIPFPINVLQPSQANSGMMMDMSYASEVYDMRCDVCSGGIGHRQWYPDQLCNAYYYNDRSEMRINIGFCILNLNPDDITWSKTNANRPTAQEDHSEMRLNDHSEMRLNSKMNANNFTTKESLPSSATSGPNDMVVLADHH